MSAVDRRQPRAAVYNRFWHSQGGGERHAGMIAEVLSGAGQSQPDPSLGPPAQQPLAVDIIGHGAVDLPTLGDHLGLDLSRCSYREIPDSGDFELAALSEEYDLWVTASYMSRLAARAPRNAYLCFFPTPFDHDYERWRRAIVRHAGKWFQLGGGALGYGVGWYPPEGGRRRRWSWTSGDAVLSMPSGDARRLRMDVGRPGAAEPVILRLTDGAGQLISEIKVEQAFKPVEVPLPESSRGTEVHFRSDTFRPTANDSRTLGVAISRMRFAGLTYDGSPVQRLRVYLAIRFPWLRNDPSDLSFLDSYNVVLANSEYTRGYIQRWWHRDAEVLFPPIATDRLRPSQQREKLIITVGRFFSPGLGHAKRQLEMVRWFGQLHRSGQLPGWRMAVVGGCEHSQLPYLSEVRRAAAGLPVDVHANAPRSLVEKLLTTAAIFWAATGYGERDDEPWAAEHFGMTTVEAMAGGCVPVVIDKAGQREIITPGVNGFRWATVADLKEQTVLVAEDEQLRSRLSEAAVARSAAFSEQAFAQRWQHIAATRLLD